MQQMCQQVVYHLLVLLCLQPSQLSKHKQQRRLQSLANPQQ
jgi:hypothetical protein